MILKIIKRAFRRPCRDVLINSFAASVWVNTWLRRMIYRVYGMELGKVWMFPGCSFVSSDLKIGDGTWINKDCVFINSSLISIGTNCNIAFGVSFVCNSHHIGPSERRAGAGLNLPITVGNGCWIGANVTILPGIEIGDGVIIGAGSVVTKNCAANGVYAGNPAKLIRQLTQD
ncbi:MAG: DapH/DapD/GlmU-related protein [Negativicutes bacterium]|nr:DapH/DapD/GlmU-related protein [Negativicutes bacterium]